MVSTTILERICAAAVDRLAYGIGSKICGGSCPAPAARTAPFFVFLKRSEKMYEKLEEVRKCLALISRITARGARCLDACNVVDALVELRLVLSPDVNEDPTDQIYSPSPGQLDDLHQELEYLEWISQEYAGFENWKYGLPGNEN